MSESMFWASLLILNTDFFQGIFIGRVKTQGGLFERTDILINPQSGLSRTSCDDDKSACNETVLLISCQ